MRVHRLECRVHAIDLQDLDVGQHHARIVLDPDILQPCDGGIRARRLEVGKVLVLAVLQHQQPDALAVIWRGELDLPRPARRDRHELRDDVDLVGQQIRDARIRRLAHEIHLGGIIEQALGQQPRHVDVHAGQVAAIVLEVPRRIGSAGTHHQLAPLEHLLELAGAGCLCLRRLGERQSRRRGHRGHPHATPEHGSARGIRYIVMLHDCCLPGCRRAHLGPTTPSMSQAVAVPSPCRFVMQASPA